MSEDQEVFMFGTFDLDDTSGFWEEQERSYVSGLGAVVDTAPVEARPSLPDDAKARLDYPMADGLLDYFPNALAEVSRLSMVATQQHHPGEPLHWERGKSTDHRNKILRHLIDTGKKDDKGMRHSTMVAWRALALLQEELEEQEHAPMPRNAR